MTALKATYGEGTTIIAQKKPKQETGYNFFVKEKTAEFKKQNVASDVRMKQIRELWHQLGDQGKDEYTLKAGGIVKPKTVKTESPVVVAQEIVAVKTDTTCVKVETPVVVKVETPVVKAEKVSVAIKKVAILKAKVEEPIAKVEEPIAKVEEPIAKVEEPIAKAAEPIQKVEAPIKKVMVKKAVDKAVETPATALVEAPVAKVESHVAKIESPVAKVETVPVVAKVETVPVVAKVPIVKTGAGYNHFKKIRTEELKTQEKGLSGTDRVAKVNAEWNALTEAQKIEWTEKAQQKAPSA